MPDRRRTRSVAGGVAALLALASAPSVVAQQQHGPNGLLVVADIATSGGSVSVDSVAGDIQDVTLIARRDLHTRIPSGAAGALVGRLTIGTAGSDLRLPRKLGGARLALLHRGRLSVVFIPRDLAAGHAVLRVTGLPRGSTRVQLSFNRASGRPLLYGTCPGTPTLTGRVVLGGATKPVSMTNGSRCYQQGR